MRIKDNGYKLEINTEICRTTEECTEWVNMRDAVLRAGEGILGEKEKTTKHEWMTSEIVELINKKRYK